jgi:hypothetical protein
MPILTWALRLTATACIAVGLILYAADHAVAGTWCFFGAIACAVVGAATSSRRRT